MPLAPTLARARVAALNRTPAEIESLLHQAVQAQPPTDFKAVLDTCVLVNSCIRDALIRQAEKPATYLPRWSLQIIDEVRRTLLGPHFGLSDTQVQHLLDELQRAFPSA